MNKSAILSIFAIAMMLTAGFGGFVVSADAQTPHPNPKALPVPFSGWPWYIEDYVTGGTVSDYGSHYGVKANLTDDTFGKMMYYTCFTSYVNGELDRGAFDFRTSSGSALSGAKRSVEFSPWGWTETVAGQAGTATMTAAFIGTDVLLMDFYFTNLGQNTGISPVLSLSGEFGKKTENMMAATYVAWQIPLTYGTLNSDGSATIYNFEQAIVTTNPEAAQTMLSNTTTYRTFVPSFKIAGFTQSSSVDRYSYEMKGEETQVAAGATKHFWVIVGFDQSASGSQSNAQAGKSLVGFNATS
ncbi:MAG: hypothetical protein PHH26_06740, partial [Candidatus Thermoplasmatota archaeon]|nr:hypothetical protein [Candidatus Thermoplasmatota archaeon]